MCLAGFAIIVSQICSVFLCFVGGIFRFANLPSGFAKFFRICWIFGMDWFVRSWHPFGWQENCQENVVTIFIYFWVH